MRFVWLHGFASGPTSSKGQFVRARLRERGEDLLLPDLNQPSFFELTVTRMLGQLDALLPEGEPLALFGSSLGGFTAATWAAARPGRVRALVLLAPAFDLGPRWESGMGKDAAAWRAAGRFAFDHHARGGKQDLSIGFLDDARRYESFPLPRCPTLVFQGARDEVVDPSLAREFTRRMQGRAQLVELPEGHELNADLPGLWKRIDAFLEAYVPRPMPK
jgi:uncharacterized protein